MSNLNMLDMNSLNAIAGYLRHAGQEKMADNLLAIQMKATRMLEEPSNLTTIYKTVNVTNPKNVLVQIPSYVAGVSWGLKQDDKLEVLYSDETQEITIRPAVRGRSGADEEG